MMIFLLILKIIGIVLCVILGMIAVILFVPIFYEADANIDEMDYKVRVHWLAKLIRFEFRWREKAHAALKILWFVIDFTDPEAVAARKAKKEAKARKKLLKQQKKEAKEREKQVRQSRKEAQQEQADCEVRAQQREAFRKQQEETANADGSLRKEASVAQEKKTYEKAEQLKSENVRQEFTESEKAEANESKASILEKLKAAHEKTGSILDKVKTVLAVIRYLREQELISAVWVKLQVFLLHIRPRKLSGNLKFGLSNPADTGQILGVIAMVPLFYQTELQIEPDFEAEDNYIQGQLSVKGHICCIHLVILSIRLLRDEKIRTLIRTIREKN